MWLEEGAVKVSCAGGALNRSAAETFPRGEDWREETAEVGAGGALSRSAAGAENKLSASLRGLLRTEPVEEGAGGIVRTGGGVVVIEVGVLLGIRAGARRSDDWDPKWRHSLFSAAVAGQ